MMEPPSSNGRAPLNGPGPFFPEPGPGAGFEQEFEIIVIDSRWRSHVPRLESVVRRAVMAACRQLADAGGGPETVVLTSDREVKRLNARHRGRNKPTNVLTFEPMPGYPGGEIVLGLEIVCREARAASRSVSAHLSHLVVHGMLHLDGFDHEQAGDARRMEMEEARILSTIGVPNPWKPGYGRHGL